MVDRTASSIFTEKTNIEGPCQQTRTIDGWVIHLSRQNNLFLFFFEILCSNIQPGMLLVFLPFPDPPAVRSVPTSPSILSIAVLLPLQKSAGQAALGLLRPSKKVPTNPAVRLGAASPLVLEEGAILCKCAGVDANPSNHGLRCLGVVLGGDW